MEYIIRLRTEDETKVFLGDKEQPFSTQEAAVEAAKEVARVEREGQEMYAQEIAHAEGWEWDAESFSPDGTVYVETAETNEDGEYFGSAVWYQNV